jgi:hypothetical protein
LVIFRRQDAQMRPLPRKAADAASGHFLSMEYANRRLWRLAARGRTAPQQFTLGAMRGE